LKKISSTTSSKKESLSNLKMALLPIFDKVRTPIQRTDLGYSDKWAKN
jgi:hypothetical protein